MRRNTYAWITGSLAALAWMLVGCQEPEEKGQPLVVDNLGRVLYGTMEGSDVERELWHRLVESQIRMLPYRKYWPGEWPGLRAEIYEHILKPCWQDLAEQAGLADLHGKAEAFQRIQDARYSGNMIQVGQLVIPQVQGHPLEKRMAVYEKTKGDCMAGEFSPGIQGRAEGSRQTTPRP